MEATESTENAGTAPEPVSTPAPDAGPDAAPVAVAPPALETPSAEDAPPASEAESPRPRQVGRTIALIAVAAVLGIVGGTAVGYGIQAEREPTPLPALNQPDLAYPKPLPRDQKPVPLTAAEDRRVRTDGDLRKLLLPKPAGAQKAEFADEDGWMSLRAYANDFISPGSALSYQLENRIRRIATTSWKAGGNRSVEIRLLQYRSSDVLGAKEHAEDQMAYMPDEKYARNEGDPIKGSANGRYYIFPVHKESGYLDFYEARAYFHRGDIMVEISVFDTKKISKKDISSLAERQLGRL
ncbi:hypothetical protein ACFVZW_04655 [Streptomyces sp. NPDC059567]|uniref:hypothetical protein n=1 Tax=Streptomyces sp. NPDC059567 TaxID=3346867 RepID=UPI0036B07DA0